MHHFASELLIVACDHLGEFYNLIIYTFIIIIADSQFGQHSQLFMYQLNQKFEAISMKRLT